MCVDTGDWTGMQDVCPGPSLELREVSWDEGGCVEGRIK